MTYLPDDILFMICTQLWHQRDFNTLFNCICSGKQLAALSVTYLYRYQDVTPVPFDYGMSMSQEEWTSTKRISFWRTIILSSLGKTLYPYSRYIRTLNLRDLKLFLLRGSENSKNDFFRGELAKLKFVAKGVASDSHCQLDTMEIINVIGEVITKQTPLLEKLTGKLRSGELSRWIPRLPRLTHLELEPWHGGAIEGHGNLIRLHCPLFKGLNISDCLEWYSHSSKYDQGQAAFINELRPQSLESFQTFDCRNVGLESFQALSCHGESLIELKLQKLSSGIIPKLSLLKDCKNLVSLSLAGNRWYTIDLKTSSNDALLETVTWLKECKRLRILTFTEFFRATALMTPILFGNCIQLTSFDYECSLMRDIGRFLQALANQTSLQRLYLMGEMKGDAGEVNESDLDPDILVQSLRNLVNLTHLHLGEISSSLDDEHIVQLARSLPKLEAWSTKGHEPTDEIWGEVASLRSLQRLEISATLDFTAEGILDFVEKLGPGNKDFVLSVVNEDIDMDFSRVSKNSIQEVIAKKVGGRFEYTLSHADPYESDSDAHYYSDYCI